MPRAYRDYLQDILQAARHIEEHTASITREAFAANDLLIRVVGFDLIVIGEACNHIPEAVREHAPDIEWDVIIAMRNRIVHGYWQIDLPTVWQAAQVYVPQLSRQIEALLNDLPDED